MTDPTEDELIAISTAVATVLTSATAAAPEPAAPSRWRFSGRWWSKPIPLRRRRPY